MIFRTSLEITTYEVGKLFDRLRYVIFVVGFNGLGKDFEHLDLLLTWLGAHADRDGEFSQVLSNGLTVVC